MSEPTYVAVAGVDDVTPGRSAAYKVNGASIALFNIDGEFIAVDNRCPHQGAPLAGSPILKNGRVRCMLHGWLFSLHGCEEDDDLKRYPVRVTDGKVEVSSDAYPIDHVV